MMKKKKMYKIELGPEVVLSMRRGRIFVDKKKKYDRVQCRCKDRKLIRSDNL